MLNEYDYKINNTIRKTHNAIIYDSILMATVLGLMSIGIAYNWFYCKMYFKKHICVCWSMYLTIIHFSVFLKRCSINFDWTWGFCGRRYVLWTYTYAETHIHSVSCKRIAVLCEKNLGKLYGITFFFILCIFIFLETRNGHMKKMDLFVLAWIWEKQMYIYLSI